MIHCIYAESIFLAPVFMCLLYKAGIGLHTNAYSCPFIWLARKVRPATAGRCAGFEHDHSVDGNLFFKVNASQRLFRQKHGFDDVQYIIL